MPSATREALNGKNHYRGLSCQKVKEMLYWSDKGDIRFADTVYSKRSFAFCVTGC